MIPEPRTEAQCRDQVLERICFDLTIILTIFRSSGGFPSFLLAAHGSHRSLDINLDLSWLKEATRVVATSSLNAWPVSWCK